MDKSKSVNLVEDFKEKGKARLKELREQIGPLTKERDELEAMLNPAPAPVKEKRETPAPAAKAPAPARSGKRNRKGGTRQEHFVSLVESKPGITVSEAATAMKIKPNYLYRVASEALRDGEVKQNEKKGYIPA